MTTITIERNSGSHQATRTLAAAALVGILAIAGIAQAADSERITPPNPNEVAILRGLLALQHPALRQAGAAVPASPTPAVTTEPGDKNSPESSSATEGEACIAPAAPGIATCGFETDSATVSVAGSFRASLDRAMAAADISTGY